MVEPKLGAFRMPCSPPICRDAVINCGAMAAICAWRALPIAAAACCASRFIGATLLSPPPPPPPKVDCRLSMVDLVPPVGALRAASAKPTLAGEESAAAGGALAATAVPPAGPPIFASALATYLETFSLTSLVFLIQGVGEPGLETLPGPEK